MASPWTRQTSRHSCWCEGGSARVPATQLHQRVHSVPHSPTDKVPPLRPPPPPSPPPHRLAAALAAQTPATNPMVCTPLPATASIPARSLPVSARTRAAPACKRRCTGRRARSAHSILPRTTPAHQSVLTCAQLKYCTTTLIPPTMPSTISPWTMHGTRPIASRTATYFACGTTPPPVASGSWPAPLSTWCAELPSSLHPAACTPAPTPKAVPKLSFPPTMHAVCRPSRSAWDSSCHSQLHHACDHHSDPHPRRNYSE